MNVSSPSFLKALTRVFGHAGSPDGGYVFNLRGRWRYESQDERRRQPSDPLRGMWSGEVLAYGWLARQAKERAQKEAPRKPDAQILALTRS